MSFDLLNKINMVISQLKTSPVFKDNEDYMSWENDI